MTKPSQRGHRRRHVKVRLPSGKRTLHFQPRAHSRPTCSRCGAQLHGVISKRAGLPASSRRPTRPYAGVLCGNCLTSEIRQLVRSASTSK
ncbi:50S ribosomal protein L34e [Candidatus Bathyarchaeota archaeon]|nr:MAG: 50S ribosomal protein L34e [Candidatus Bathyarchaeota archaeon]TMI31552.1 MAG: 50S ribosomal protein L34e [Candidatus Bathyarchaeota archaeon]